MVSGHHHLYSIDQYSNRNIKLCKLFCNRHQKKCTRRPIDSVWLLLFMNLLSVTLVSKHKLHKKILQKQQLPQMSRSRQSRLTDRSAIFRALVLPFWIQKKRIYWFRFWYIFFFFKKIKEIFIQIAFFNEFLHISIQIFGNKMVF